ncbi:MAG: hypothetical protein LBT21_03195 [Oscillospiraceae bacterium]|jgi:hypothetical protein|nr:hypothetical protein [Oscillospiraceae bacterium]
MAGWIDIIAQSASISKMKKTGEGRDRPRKWMKSPVVFRFSQPISLDLVLSALQEYCEQNKHKTSQLKMQVDPQQTGMRFQNVAWSGIVQWECAMVFNNDTHTELFFQVLNWFDNAGCNIGIYKLISYIERTFLSVYPDAIVVEDNTQKRMADLY